MSMVPDPPIALDYHRAAPSRRTLPLWARLVLVLATLPALFTPWAPYDWNTSAWDVIENTLLPPRWPDTTGRLLTALALPFFVSPLIFLWSLRLAIHPRATWIERWLVYLPAAGSTLCTAYVLARLMLDSSGPPAAFPYVIAPAAVAGLVIVLMIGLRQQRLPGEWIATAALRGAYLANAALCIGIFCTSHEIGWRVTLLAGILLLGELVVYGVLAVLWRAGRRAG